jgi:hypothetical protein
LLTEGSLLNFLNVGDGVPFHFILRRFPSSLQWCTLVSSLVIFRYSRYGRKHCRNFPRISGRAHLSLVSESTLEDTLWYPRCWNMQIHRWSPTSRLYEWQ